MTEALRFFFFFRSIVYLQDIEQCLTTSSFSFIERIPKDAKYSVFSQLLKRH